MGSPPDESGRKDSESPRHWVTISPFAIGVREVTVAEFRHFVDATGYRTEAERGGGCEVVDGLDREGAHSWLAARHDCNGKAGKVAPVASYQANGFHLHDTIGNVWEWVADCWHDSYAGAPGSGVAWRPDGVEVCSTMAVRGGSWESSSVYNRSATRVERPSRIARSTLGFRVAATL